jgi:hypothetical protein
MGAADLLAEAVSDGQKLGETPRRLLTLKDEAHYGVIMVSARKARDAVNWASKLVARAQDEVER